MFHCDPVIDRTSASEVLRRQTSDLLDWTRRFPDAVDEGQQRTGLPAQTRRPERLRQVHWVGSRGIVEAAAVENQRRPARHRRKRGLALAVQGQVGFPVEGRSGMYQGRRRALTPGQVGVAGRGWGLEADELQSEVEEFPP